MSIFSSSGKGDPTTLSKYKTTLANQDTIFKNLQTTQDGVARTVSDSNARILAGMNRLAANGSAGVAKAVQRGDVRAKNMFGSAMGGTIKTDLLGATATAKGSAETSAATAKAGQTLVNAGQTSRDIMDQAVQAAHQSATYEAQVLQQQRKAATANKGLSTAESALLTTAQSGATYSQALADAQSLAQINNLGPAAAAELTTTYLTTLGYDSTKPDSVAAVSTATGPVDKFGQPIPMDIADDSNGQDQARQHVVAALTSDKTLQDVIDATKAGLAGAYPQSYIDSAVALVTKYWNAAEPAYKAAGEAMTKGGLVGSGSSPMGPSAGWGMGG